MAYNGITWVDGKTPLNAQNLNTMNEGIKSVDSKVTEVVATINGINTEMEGVKTSLLSHTHKASDIIDLPELGAGVDKTYVDEKLNGKVDSVAYQAKVAELEAKNLEQDSAIAGKVSTSTTVNGKALTGNVEVTKADLGLGKVDNTSDLEKPISTATKEALSTKLEAKNIIQGNNITITTQDGNVTISADNVGGTAGLSREEVESLITAHNSEETAHNDIRTAIKDLPTKAYVDGAINGKVSTETMVNGKPLSSDVTLSKTDIGLPNVDNTSDMDKPISTAVQTALDTKLEAQNIIQGDNITISKQGNNITISAQVTASGGSNVDMSEVTSSIQKALSEHNISAESHSDIRALIQERLSAQNIKGSGNVKVEVVEGNVVISVENLATGASTDFNDLQNIPTLDGVELKGTLTKETLNIAEKSHQHNVADILDFPEIPVVDVTKKYVDDELAKKSDVTHSHDETYASKSSEHSHTNKAVLDAITQEKISAWDNPTITTKISTCEDVKITDIQNGESLVWDSATGKFVNAMIESTATSGGFDLTEWQASKAYEVGDCVAYRKFVYKCKVSNSDVVFDATKWDVLIGDRIVFLTKEEYATLVNENKVEQDVLYITQEKDGSVSGASSAEEIAITPIDGMVATNVQEAIVDLDTRITSLSAQMSTSIEEVLSLLD